MIFNGGFVMWRFLDFCLCALVAVSAISAAAEDDALISVGMAGTYRGAVDEALVLALERHDGVTMATTARRQVATADAKVSEGRNGALDDRKKLEMKDAVAKDMAKWAAGKIKSFEVLSDAFENGRYRVEVLVRFAGAYVVGLDPANRRRMAVVPFRVATGDSISWFGKAESSAAWAGSLADRLNERLTQTRKFTMVDRKFDDEVGAELARLTGINASKADAQRLCQKLGTDYLIVGEVRLSPVAAPGVNPLTGQALPMASQRFAEVSYRVLLAPTGQIKWSDSIVIDALDYQAADILTFVALTADGAAAEIADGIMGCILPLEIVGKTPTGQLIIGEGGKSLAAGERFTVFALGETVADSRTGEELDEIEEPVGTVEIVRVTAKMSYARVVEGDAGKMVAGSRLRRAEVIEASDVRHAPVTTTTIRSNGAGGVVAPF